MLFPKIDFRRLGVITLVIRFFFFHVHNPLAFIAAYVALFVKPFYYEGVVLYFFVLISYVLIGSIGQYLFSLAALKDFNKNFLSQDRKFELKFSPGMQEVIDSHPGFSKSEAKLGFARHINMSDEAIQLFSKPNLGFVAEPLGQFVLSSCKAYSHLFGYNFIIGRTNNINDSAFERFLAYHELNHIDDRGITHLQLLIGLRAKYFVDLLILVGGAILLSDYWLLLVALLYGFFTFLDKWGMMINKREILADHAGVSAIVESRDRIKILKLLIRSYDRNFQSAKGLEKNSWNERLKALKFRLEIEESDLPDKHYEHELNTQKTLSSFFAVIALLYLFPYESVPVVKIVNSYSIWILMALLIIQITVITISRSRVLSIFEALKRI